MKSDADKKRMEAIIQMITELASGNFSHRIESSDMDDEMETIAVMLNMMAEEMKESFIHQGYVNLHDTYRHFVQIAIVLDDTFQIRAFNSRLTDILLLKAEEVKNRSFTDLLAEESVPVWEDLKKKMGKSDHFDTHVEFLLKTKQHLVTPVTCLVTTFLDQSNSKRAILITAIETVKRSEELEKEFFTTNDRPKKDGAPAKGDKKTPTLNRSDIQTIREIHDHLLKNLEKPPLSLREIAHTFGTNEFKLKYGFKQLYGTTVIRFLINERLKKANVLVKYTNMTFKKISIITGFKSFPHFSRVFKAKYKVNPRKLRKKFMDWD